MELKKPQVDWPSTSLLLGIVCVPAGLLFGIPAIIVGHLALRSIKANPITGRRWMAFFGLAAGYLSTFFWIMLLLLLKYQMSHPLGNSR